MKKYEINSEANVDPMYLGYYANGQYADMAHKSFANRLLGNIYYSGGKPKYMTDVWSGAGKRTNLFINFINTI